MNTDQMRSVLKRQYGGAWKWVQRVNNMHDQQVIAVYYRMSRAGQLK